AASTGTPSSVAVATPRQRRAGLDTAISYRLSRNFHTIPYSGHDEGMHGSTMNVSPRRRRPRMLSTPARYIHPAEPVYQLHPPRPACGGRAYTSPAITYGSVL